MYVSNENPTLVDVYFDDVVMTHTKSNVIQYNEYYPFGMNTANSWTRENVTGNNFLGNGGTELNQTSQLYDLDYRNYDPILGRMNGIDPMATKYASLSPYNFSFNDPVTFNDPSGADPYQRSDDTWWVASRQSLYGSRYTGFSSVSELAFQNQAVNISTNPWDWTGMGSGDIYGSEFSQYGVGSGYGSISHQEYVNAVEQAKEKGGRVEFHHGRYWVSVPLVRTFFVETPDDPNYTGYNVTMTWAGREGILVNGGGIRPHYRQTQGRSSSVLQAGMGPGMTTDEFRGLLDGILLTTEGFLLNQERNIQAFLKSPASKGERQLFKTGLKNVKAFGHAAGVLAVAVSWWEASEKGTTGAYSLATLDTIIAGATLFFPALAPITLTYGVIRLGLDMAGVDVAGGIDKLIN